MDFLRLDVAPAESGSGDTFELKVFVNDVDVLGWDEGLGMDPLDVFFPTNRLLARPGPHTTAIGRCACGDYGCRPSDVTITRDGSRVRWDWHGHEPMDRSVSFDASAYTAEVTRMAGDFNWESPQRTAQRLAMGGVQPGRPPRRGEPGWKHRSPRRR